MKLLIKIGLAIACLALIASSLKVKIQSESSAKTETLSKTELMSKEDFTVQWNNLFTNILRPPQLCMPPSRLMITKADTAEKEKDMKIPKSKPNPWAKEQGFGPSGYLWDYLDDVILSDVLSEFMSMWQSAKAMTKPDPILYADPYSLDKLVYYYSQGLEGDLFKGGLQDESKLLEIIVKYNKNFNPTVWQNSISAPQLFNILQQWGWYEFPVPDFARHALSIFDFDGDGRLNPSEFILLAIIVNKNLFRSTSCKQFCFEKVLTTKIDALYAFLDCDGDGWVSAENMWLGLQNLKRSDSSKYNLYNCQMPNAINKGYRTTSMNDFILKNWKAADGFVNIHEFRAGILLGYWDRMVDNYKVYIDDSRNKKNDRWANNGLDDITCKKILAMLPGSEPGRATLDNPIL